MNGATWPGQFEAWENAFPVKNADDVVAANSERATHSLHVR